MVVTTVNESVGVTMSLDKLSMSLLISILLLGLPVSLSADLVSEEDEDALSTRFHRIELTERASSLILFFKLSSP